MAQRNPEYASMLYALDKNIGKLIAKLKKEGLYDNTTIIFTSDNGGLSTLEPEYDFIAPTSILPLRAGKGWLYEGGIRVPLLIKPANFKEQSSISNEPVIGYDFLPTILSLANIKPADKSTINGVDLSEILVKNGKIGRKELFWHYPHYHGSGWTPGAAIRYQNWKLIEFYETETVELYNLSEDISEQNNLAAKYPKKVVDLKRRLHKLQKSVNANKAILNSQYKSLME